jgi:hypothetical protein
MMALKREPIWRAQGWTPFVLKVAGMWTGLARSVPARIVQSGVGPARRMRERRQDVAAV